MMDSRPSPGAWTFTFDAVDRVTQRQSPDAKTFSWRYNEVGTANRQTDSDSGNTYFDYDATGRLETIRSAAGLNFYFDYDAAGELTAKRLGSGAVTYLEHDAAGRVSSIVHATSANAEISRYDYTRDERGSPTKITDIDGYDRDFTYDSVNRLASETWRDDGDTLLDQKLYYYDGAYNRTALDQHDEAVIYYDYDARNAVIAEAPVGGTPTYMTYNEAGSLLTEIEGGDTTDYVWNTVIWGHNTDSACFFGGQACRAANACQVMGTGTLSPVSWV